MFSEAYFFLWEVGEVGLCCNMRFKKRLSKKHRKVLGKCHILVYLWKPLCVLLCIFVHLVLMSYLNGPSLPCPPPPILLFCDDTCFHGYLFQCTCAEKEHMVVVCVGECGVLR